MKAVAALTAAAVTCLLLIGPAPSSGAAAYPPHSSYPVPAPAPGGNPMPPPPPGNPPIIITDPGPNDGVSNPPPLPAGGSVITDPAGRPAPSMIASKQAIDGRIHIIVLEDVNFIHHIAHFDREKIPQRAVHAKGAGAHGYFEVTNDITGYTSAALFSHVGKRTPVFVRFASPVHDPCIADTLPSRRFSAGFSVKFYTEEGNWDLVGSNIEVFAIRDPILAPSLYHSFGKNPQSGLHDTNMTWDFASLRPETTHFMLRIHSHLGFPRSYRHMNGGGVSTYKMVNATMGIFFVKFLWRTNQGAEFLSLEEATELAVKKPELYGEDLFRAIERGDHPSWNLYIQAIPLMEGLKTYPWNPFDPTYVIPEKDYPPILVGKLVLNKNPDDYFTQVEMSAFDPGSMVPGIEFSPDYQMQGRSFSYLDAQRYRLGVNFLQLPINKPKVKVNTFDRDGKCAIENGQGHPNYFPNSVDGSFVSPRGEETHFNISARVVREDFIEDNFSQPRIFYESLTPAQKERLAKTLALTLVGVRADIVERVFDNFRKVSADLPEAVSKAIADVEQGGEVY